MNRTNKNQCNSHFKKGISEKTIIISLILIASTIPTVFFFLYLNHSKEKAIKPETITQPIPNKKITETTVDHIISQDCIFKNATELSLSEREYVLNSAKQKIIKVLNEEHNFAWSWITVCAKPMSNTELEVLGDSLTKEIHKDSNIYDDSVIKMPVYWNETVADFCMNTKHRAESQFYNSYWEAGERAKTGLSKPLKSLDDFELARSACEESMFSIWCRVVKYDQKRQIIVLETNVRCMTELIWNTFSGLGKGTPGCPFDRIPSLTKIEILYKDTDNNLIGHALFDLEYWCELIQTEIIPISISDQETKDYSDIEVRYKSKLLTEKEYHDKNSEIRELYNDLSHEYYQNTWIKLFPLIEDFELNKELPIKHEKFHF